LKPSFRNQIGGWYQAYRFLTQKSLSFEANYYFTANDIITSSATDAAGKTVSRSVNLKEKNTSGFDVYVGYSHARKKGGVAMSVTASLRGNKFYAYTNGLLNTTTAYSYAGNFSVYKGNKQYNVMLSLTPTYTVNQSS